MNKHNTKDSLAAWEINAKFWDDCMGEDSNDFHRQVIRPKVSELMNVCDDDFILDVACGNGNYSAYMANLGANVVAFDYSYNMIKLAKKRQVRYDDKIEFHVVDATIYDEVVSLKKDRPYNKAVSNMAIMDITNVDILFKSVNELLEDDGIFVFATQHPCFVTLTDKYFTPHHYQGEAISGQPSLQYYYHRSLQDIFKLCFNNGFCIDGFYEESYISDEIPDVIIVRAKKIKDSF